MQCIFANNRKYLPLLDFTCCCQETREIKKKNVAGNSNFDRITFEVQDNYFNIFKVTNNLFMYIFFRTMPKCSHVVLLIISTNILTLTIYSSIKLNYDSLFSKIQKTSSWAQPQPQPFQYSRIQTGRVIQSLDEGHQDLTQYPKQQQIISSTEISKVNKNKNLFLY